MKRTKFFGVLALVIIMAALGTASAFGGNFFGMDPESREDMVNAIEANNYEDWKAAKSDRLTEQNFNERVARHEVRFGMREHRGDKIQAIETGNYEAFKLSAENWPMSSKIQDKGDFEMLVQLHQAKLDRDYETVNELREQLGLPGGFGEHKISGQSGRGWIT